MEHGYKHFSHSHNLVMHQLPEGVDVSCSGCNSSGNGTVYICWQCNFFLHEQCYRATRSLKHPSHPLHPLTLVPYPTYPSNSFYCNSCEIIGTGLSYSCAHCEFDLHVQCAYSISIATSFQKAHQYPTNYYNPDHQEQVPPTWNGQNSSVPHNIPFVSVPDSNQYPLNASLNPYMNPNQHSVSIPNQITSTQFHSTGQDLAHVSIPPARQNSNTAAPNPSTTQTGHSISLSGSVHYPSIAQTGPSTSVPASSQNPVIGALYSSAIQSGPSVSILANSQDSITGTQYPSMTQPRPTVSIPSIPPNLVPITENSSKTQNEPFVTIPTNNLNPITSDQKINTAQNIALVTVPNVSPDYQPDNHVESGPNQLSNNRGIKHFSHPHSLRMVNFQDTENEVDCSGCEETLDGKGYSCNEPNCEFHLHELCFHLKQQIQHKSHPEHPLTLLPLAPYDNENGEFTCNACFSDGTGFTYHCSICKFDLHIQCVSLPETVKRDDHDHMLKLYYSCPVKDEEYTFSCDVCHVAVQKDRWTYYCESCDYGTHLGCVDCEECVVDSVIDTQMQLQRLQFQMEMSRQNAQMIASMGASLANLA